MARIPLITERSGLSDEQAAVFDRIVGSRGSLIRPFQVLLHTPELAARIGEVGHAIRFQGGLEGPDRELVILAAGRVLGCAFVWESHLGSAREAGVRPEAIAALEGSGGELTAWERLLVSFVEELSRTGTVSGEVFSELHRDLGTPGIVELSVVVGYYTMLGLVMSVNGAC